MATADTHVSDAITHVADESHVPDRGDTNNDENGDLQVTKESVTEVAASAEPPYSVLSSRQKKVTIMIVSFVALISPLAGNIYYPAISTLATEFNVSTTMIQLTITTYQVSRASATCYPVFEPSPLQQGA